MVLTFNPDTGEAEAGGSASLVHSVRSRTVRVHTEGKLQCSGGGRFGDEINWGTTLMERGSEEGCEDLLFEEPGGVGTGRKESVMCEAMVEAGSRGPQSREEGKVKV